MPTGVVELYDKIHPSNLEWKMGQHVAFGRSCGTVAGRHTSNNGSNMLVCVLLLFQSNAISRQIRKVFIFFFPILFMSNKTTFLYCPIPCSWGFNQKYCKLGLLVALGRNNILDVQLISFWKSAVILYIGGTNSSYNMEVVLRYANRKRFICTSSHKDLKSKHSANYNYLNYYCCCPICRKPTDHQGLWVICVIMSLISFDRLP